MEQQVQDPRRPTSRRAVVQGAAWTVPVIAMAATAPAYAASCIRQTYTMNWTESRLNRAGFRSATATAVGANAGSLPLIITLTSVSYSGGAINNDVTTSNNRPDVDRNLTIPPQVDGTNPNLDPGVTSLGGRANERGIRLQHTRSDIGRDNRQEVTIGFSRPIRALDFFITDIDRISSPAYADRVELTSASSDTRVQTLDGVTGNGIQNSPWLRSGDLNVDENDPGAQVRVKYNGTADMSSLTLTYWNNAGGTQYHRIFIGNMTFTAAGC